MLQNLAIGALKIPQGVVCLVLALVSRGLTTQIPHAVDVALKSVGTRPRLAFAPVRVFWFSAPAGTEGLEVHPLDDTPVRVYGLIEPSVAAKVVAGFARTAPLARAADAGLAEPLSRREVEIVRLLYPII